MNEKIWRMLQLFAGEGAGGDGGGEGAATGDTAVDAGQQRLRELGVPEDKIRRRAKKSAVKLPEGAVTTVPKEQQNQEQAQVAAAEDVTPTEENNQAEEKAEAPARLSWEEIMKDPEYNKQMQAVVQSRLRTAKGAEETLSKLTPALELLARKHGQDPANPDYDALAKAISDDASFYEDKALEMGVSVETAMKIDQQERDTARQEREQARTLEQQKIQQHFDKLQRQGEAMKAVFPNFDLHKEMQNPAFVRLTAPDSGLTVEDAYYALHRKEIQQAAMEVTAQKTAQKISNAIQAGSRRPQENGTSAQAASVTSFDYRTASPEQRAALKMQIRQAAARGEKIYPGR